MAESCMMMMPNSSACFAKRSQPSAKSKTGVLASITNAVSSIFTKNSPDRDLYRSFVNDPNESVGDFGKTVKSSTTPKHNVKYSTQTLPSEFTVCANFYMGKEPGMLVFESSVPLGIRDIVEITDGEHKGIYQIVNMGSANQNWILEKME
jgi:hypothetical protein